MERQQRVYYHDRVTTDAPFGTNGNGLQLLRMYVEQLHAKQNH
jgi:hypothetical protein